MEIIYIYKIIINRKKYRKLIFYFDDYKMLLIIRSKNKIDEWYVYSKWNKMSGKIRKYIIVRLIFFKVFFFIYELCIVFLGVYMYLSVVFLGVRRGYCFLEVDL